MLLVPLRASQAEAQIPSWSRDGDAVGIRWRLGGGDGVTVRRPASCPKPSNGSGTALNRRANDFEKKSLFSLFPPVQFRSIKES